MTLDEALKRAIRQSDLTPHAMEMRSGVSRANIARYLAGTRTITIDTADRLLRVLGCAVTVGPKDAAPRLARANRKA